MTDRHAADSTSLIDKYLIELGHLRSFMEKVKRDGWTPKAHAKAHTLLADYEKHLVLRIWALDNHQSLKLHADR